MCPSVRRGQALPGAHMDPQDPLETVLGRHAAAVGSPFLGGKHGVVEFYSKGEMAVNSPALQLAATVTFFNFFFACCNL